MKSFDADDSPLEQTLLTLAVWSIKLKKQRKQKYVTRRTLKYCCYEEVGWFKGGLNKIYF